MNYLRPTGFKMLPAVIKNLLIINVLFFLADMALEQIMGIKLSSYLGLFFFKSDNFYPFQLVSYMFMHGDFSHILFNMFALWMFGTNLENYWGPKRFLIYYFVCGVGAGLLHMGVSYYQYLSVIGDLPEELIRQITTEGHGVLMSGKDYVDASMSKFNHVMNIPTVGASGAVFGLLLAFGMTFPNSRIYVFFAIPIKAKYFVMIYGAIELYSGVMNQPGDNVAHFAHLGGMLFGFFLIKLWQKNQFRKY